MIIAVTNDLSKLNLDKPAARNHLGDHHFWSPDNSVFFLVCRPKRWRPCAAYLQAHGAQVLPPLHDPVSQVGAAFAALAGFNVLATDTAWSAAVKLHDGSGWPAFDPVEK